MQREIKEVYIKCISHKYRLGPLEKICHRDPNKRRLRPGQFGVYIQGCDKPSFWDYGIVFEKNKKPIVVTA